MWPRCFRIVTGIGIIVGTCIATRQATADDAANIETREVAVNALSFSKGSDGKAFGNCFPIRVTIGGNPPGKVRIGFYETEVGGSGEQWKAAGWMAAVTAAQLTDFHPASLQVAFEVQGRVDGPSAGALLTVGILAAVRGDTVRADAAMTGTINPDGMIGPVSGIVHKIEGAARTGKKLVLIPATLEMEQDQNTKEMVNLIQHGVNLGVEVRTVVDIYEAYQLMTGVDLPRPPLRGKPTTDLKTDQLMAQHVATWTSMIENVLEKYKAIPEDARSEYTDELIEVGNKHLTSAQRLIREGAIHAAYADMIIAATNIYAARETAYSYQTYDLQGLEGVIKRINDNSWLQGEIDKTAAVLKPSIPISLNQLVLYFDACDVFIEAVTLQKMAAFKLKNLPEDEDKRDVAALEAADWQITSYLDCKIARDYLELMKQYEGKPIPADAPFLETAQFYRRASDASLDVFDTLTVSEIAKVLRVGKVEAQAVLAQKDFSYGLLYFAQRDVVTHLRDYVGDGPQLAYATLAGSIYLHAQAASLIAKYYSLDAKLDEDLEVTSIGREQTFNDWLAASDEQARRNIMLLDQHGIDTSTCATGYEMANALRFREVSDKLFALQIYFYLNVQTKVLQRLSGVTLDSFNAAPPRLSKTVKPGNSAPTVTGGDSIKNSPSKKAAGLSDSIFNRP